jgi:hypothetical protein
MKPVDSMQCFLEALALLRRAAPSGPERFVEMHAGVVNELNDLIAEGNRLLSGSKEPKS